MGSDVKFNEKDANLLLERVNENMRRAAEDRARRLGKPVRLDSIPQVTLEEKRPADTRARLFAAGRLPSGAMNKTEARYHAEVIEPMMRCGAATWSRFGAIKLRLAAKTFLTVDFAVLRSDGVLELIDVKGAKIVYQEDAKVKMKVAAEQFTPFVFTVAYPRRKRDGGGWLHEAVK